MGKSKSSKYDNAVPIYEKGMSIGECASFYNISRQAMHKILIRRGCTFRSNLKMGNENHFFRGLSKDNTKKKRVQHLVFSAIRNGILINPNKCDNCLKDNTFKDGRTGIQAHHCDYDKPLDIMWLCQSCHHEWHKNNQPLNEN